MKASEEVRRLQEKLKDGSLHPDEPLFVLRARDLTSPHAVCAWVSMARLAGAPSDKTLEASLCAAKMREWPVKQVPGKPETRKGDSSRKIYPPSDFVYCSACGEAFPAHLEVKDDVCPKCNASGCLGPHEPQSIAEGRANA